MWASVIHEKKEEKAKGHGWENQNPRQKKKIYIYTIHFLGPICLHSLPQIKRVMVQGVNQKYLDRTTTKNSTHLHISIKVYDLYLLMVQALTWQHKCHKYAHLNTFPKLHSQPYW